MNILWLEEVDSTNSYIEREADKMDAPAMAVARFQTAGHGQRGNGWESGPGQNLTLSVLIRPEKFPASAQFAISEATALAVVDFLNKHGVESKVKWPNDVYVGDRKISGILIKHSLMGSEISHSILGVGININQTHFVSDAPNPVSLTQITGEEYDLAALAAEFARCLEKRLASVHGDRRRELHDEFLRLLWRGDGKPYLFRDTSTGEEMLAAISDVDMQGVLTLRFADDTYRSYLFKEVGFII